MKYSLSLPGFCFVLFFSCCRKQFLPTKQALEENEQHIIFSEELEQKKKNKPKAPAFISPLHLQACTNPRVWLVLKGKKKGGG